MNRATDRMQGLLDDGKLTTVELSASARVDVPPITTDYRDGKLSVERVADADRLAVLDGSVCLLWSHWIISGLEWIVRSTE